VKQARSKVQITYNPRSDATVEAEVSALVAAYHFILLESSGAKLKAAKPTQADSRDDPKKPVNEQRRLA